MVQVIECQPDITVRTFSQKLHHEYLQHDSACLQHLFLGTLINQVPEGWTKNKLNKRQLCLPKVPLTPNGYAGFHLITQDKPWWRWFETGWVTIRGKTSPFYTCRGPETSKRPNNFARIIKLNGINNDESERRTRFKLKDGLGSPPCRRQPVGYLISVLYLNAGPPNQITRTMARAGMKCEVTPRE